MALIERLSRWVADFRAAQGPETAVGASAPSDMNFGVSVNNSSALKITALYAGIRIISENVASLPKTVKRETASGPVEAKDHPAFRVVDIRPNEYTNTFDFWNCISTWLNGWGNAYAVISRDRSGKPVALHQVHPASVQVTITGGRKWYRVIVSDPNFTWLNGTYPDRDMLHFMLVTLDGVKGVNPIIYNAMSLGKGMAMERFAEEYFKKGGNIRAIMETDGHMSDTEYLSFINHFKKSSDNFETPLLEYGVKYKQLAINPVAAQLIQSEILSIQDVCRIINIPPHMIAELSHATFSNIEHQTIQFVQYTLRSFVKRLETELESKLFFDDERGDYSIKFALDGLLRGDTSARSAYYHNAILDGYMSRNEVRALEGLEHRDGLDDLLYPLNTGIVGKTNDK